MLIEKKKQRVVHKYVLGPMVQLVKNSPERPERMIASVNSENPFVEFICQELEKFLENHNNIKPDFFDIWDRQIIAITVANQIKEIESGRKHDRREIN